MRTSASEFHALSGAYAVDALDTVERQHFGHHLEGCDECQAEVAAFRETTAVIAAADPMTPPASLRAGVLASIANVRPLPPETVPPAVSPQAHGGSHLAHRAEVVPLARRRRVLASLVAAAAAVILVAAGAIGWHPWTSDRTTMADRVIHASDTVSVSRQVAGGEMTLYRSSSMKRAVIVLHDVRRPAAGKAYQLWLQQPGAGMISAGLVSDVGDTTLLTGDAATAKAAAVSIERDTGRDVPHGKVVALFPLSKDHGTA